MTTQLHIDFAGEVHAVNPGDSFVVGRFGDLAIDDNPFLHRRFLEIFFDHNLWWVANVGSRIPAQLSDTNQINRTTLSPGGKAPIVFGSMLLTFHAGNTGYEIELSHQSSLFESKTVHRVDVGETTVGSVTFTDSQLLAILALAEPVLRRVGTGSWQIPTAVQAAQRLGWTQTRFNRKLDNVCEKLARMGIKGLHGGPGQKAKNRRANLVDYAVTARVINAEHLGALDVEAKRNREAKVSQSSEAER